MCGPRTQIEATLLIQEIGDDDWDETLLARGLDDVYLSRGYVHAASIQDEAKPVLLLHRSERGGVVFPLLLRSIPGESRLTDVTSPHGYGGPIAFGEAPSWAVSTIRTMDGASRVALSRPSSASILASAITTMPTLR